MSQFWRGLLGGVLGLVLCTLVNAAPRSTVPAFSPRQTNVSDQKLEEIIRDLQSEHPDTAKEDKASWTAEQYEADQNRKLSLLFAKLKDHRPYYLHDSFFSAIANNPYFQRESDYGTWHTVKGWALDPKNRKEFIIPRHVRHTGADDQLPLHIQTDIILWMNDPANDQATHRDLFLYASDLLVSRRITLGQSDVSWRNPVTEIKSWIIQHSDADIGDAGDAFERYLEEESHITLKKDGEKIFLCGGKSCRPFSEEFAAVLRERGIDSKFTPCMGNCAAAPNMRMGGIRFSGEGHCSSALGSQGGQQLYKNILSRPIR